MRQVLFSVVLVLAASVVRADDLKDPVEFGIVGGASDGPGYAAWAPGASMNLNTGTGTFRLSAGGSWEALHKSTTPGGYSVSGGVGGQIFVGPVFVSGGFSAVYVDQTVYTKRIRYDRVGAGVRWGSYRPKSKVLQGVSTLGLQYGWETYSSYANNTRYLELLYTYDHRLGTGPWCVRLMGSVSGMWFNQGPYAGAAHRTDSAADFGIGFVFRPHRF